jgi:dTDP-4-dehydrorhamnose 3,5-epimerase
LRKDSSTYGSHLEIVIGPLEPYIGLFIPAGCAHGYLTLESNSTLIYFMDNTYSADHSDGLLWSDPRLSINWPCKPVLISDRDSEWPLLV